MIWAGVSVVDGEMIWAGVSVVDGKSESSSNCGNCRHTQFHSISFAAGLHTEGLTVLLLHSDG
jgi:hypothetical protein